MSYLEAAIVRADGEIRFGDLHLRNSHGGCTRIWEPIYQRHYHPKPRYPWGKEVDYMGGLTGATDPDAQQRFWNLAGDESIPRYVRRVLAWTYDQVIVPVAECAELADDVDRFDREYPVQADHVNHLPALAAWLRQVARTPDAEYAVMDWTSLAVVWPGRRVPSTTEFDEDGFPEEVRLSPTIRDPGVLRLSEIVP